MAHNKAKKIQPRITRVKKTSLPSPSYTKEAALRKSGEVSSKGRDLAEAARKAFREKKYLQDAAKIKKLPSTSTKFRIKGEGKTIEKGRELASAWRQVSRETSQKSLDLPTKKAPDLTAGRIKGSGKTISKGRSLAEKTRASYKAPQPTLSSKDLPKLKKKSILAKVKGRVRNTKIPRPIKAFKEAAVKSQEKNLERLSAKYAAKKASQSAAKGIGSTIARASGASLARRALSPGLRMAAGAIGKRAFRAIPVVGQAYGVAEAAYQTGRAVQEGIKAHQAHKETSELAKKLKKRLQSGGYTPAISPTGEPHKRGNK